jgi:hypothetical protein
MKSPHRKGCVSASGRAKIERRVVERRHRERVMRRTRAWRMPR